MLFENAYVYELHDSNSEYGYVSAWDRVVRDPLQLLSDCSESFKLKIERNLSDATGAVKKGTRPDIWCKLDGAVVFVGEEKVTSDKFHEALDDIKSKISPQANKVHLFAYAAGGPDLRYTKTHYMFLPNNERFD
jgi:hypothetical protein